jgi:hypothetical protein
MRIQEEETISTKGQIIPLVELPEWAKYVNGYLWMKREKEGEEKDEVRVVQQLHVLEETHG